MAASDVRPGQDTALTVQQLAEVSTPRAGAPQFRNALNNAAITLNLYPNETVTNKVLQFQRTGTNPFKGEADSAAAGRQVYDQWSREFQVPEQPGLF